MDSWFDHEVESFFDDPFLRDPFFYFPSGGRRGYSWQPQPQLLMPEEMGGHPHETGGMQLQTHPQQQGQHAQHAQRRKTRRHETPGLSGAMQNWGPMNPLMAPPALNLIEKKDCYRLDAEIPGVRKEDVKITVDKGVLCISGERKEEKREETDTVHRVEHFTGKFTRKMRLPEDANADDIRAHMQDGILSVTLSKRTQPQGATQREVRIQ